MLESTETYAKSDVARGEVLWPLLVSTSSIALKRMRGKIGVYAHVIGHPAFWRSALGEEG